MAEPRCANCRFFEAQGESKTSGLCHRLPPVGQHDIYYAAWPGVRGHNWCGEWRPEKSEKGTCDASIS